MKIRLLLLGTEVWSLHIGTCGCPEGDDETTGIGAGEGGSFERDTAPLNPNDHYGEWEDRAPRRFGFGGVS
jgi:hypothetical protein